MNRNYVLNLTFAITNLRIGIDLGKINDLDGFKYYSQQFMKITREDIDKAFPCFIETVNEEIWKVILSEQQKILKWRPSEFCHFGIATNLHNLQIMIDKLLKGE